MTQVGDETGILTRCLVNKVLLPGYKIFSACRQLYRVVMFCIHLVYSIVVKITISATRIFAEIVCWPIVRHLQVISLK